MDDWKEKEEFIRDNEYHADDSSYIYVSGFAKLGKDGIWRGSCFSEDELYTVVPDETLGIILSGNCSNAIDHAPDALYAICALEMVPGNISRILCVDRRGTGDATVAAYITRLVEGGATVIYDAGEAPPFESIIPGCWLTFHHEWVPQYRSEIRFAGPLNALHPDSWAKCHESMAANECLHILELLETGQTSRCGIENPCAERLREAVAALGRGRVAVPANFVPWASKGIEALAWRNDLHSLGEAGNGQAILAAAAIWDAQLRRRRFKPHKPGRVAKIWGVDAMLDAYLEGVPITDVVA